MADYLIALGYLFVGLTIGIVMFKRINERDLLGDREPALEAMQFLIIVLLWPALLLIVGIINALVKLGELLQKI